MATFAITTSVGKMNPIDGTDDTNQISKGNNLLIMGEVSEKSPLFKYSAHSQKKSKGMVSKFNELDNKIGDKYPVMIIHEKFLEGIDLVGVTHIILVQEPGTVGMFDQIVGRGVRNCSHKYLPSSLWKVKIISLVNVDEGATPDEVIIKHRENNTKIVETVLSKSQEYSLDCSVSQKRYDLKCK
jgi:superfamily II DNA or RNA helicase